MSAVRHCGVLSTKVSKVSTLRTDVSSRRARRVAARQAEVGIMIDAEQRSQQQQQQQLELRLTNAELQHQKVLSREKRQG